MRIEARDISEREARILIGADAWDDYKSRVEAALASEYGCSVVWSAATFYVNRAATNAGALNNWNVVTHWHGFPNELRSGYCLTVPWRGIAPDQR